MGDSSSALPGTRTGVLAGWWPRLLAMLLDVAVTTVPTVGVAVAIARSSDAHHAGSLIVWTSSMISAAYFGVFDGFGGTLGKAAAGIGVRDIGQDTCIGVARGLLRWLVRFSLYIFLLPGLLNDLWPLWDDRHQTLSDRAAQSVVVFTR